MDEQQSGVYELDDHVDAYLHAFNRMDLEAVMAYFAPDAVYEPGDGNVYRGVHSVRQAFLPQFQYAYGSMYFEEEDRVIDPGSGIVALSWICRIDARQARYYSLGIWLRLAFGRLRFGNYAQWKGIDLLHFEPGGKIFRKQTYANYSALKIEKSSPREI